MLAGITLSGKWAKRLGSEAPRSFDFEPGVNLLVGPNSSGKSSILGAIMDLAGQSRRGEKNPDINVRLVSGKERFAVRMFDFERQNPRVQDRLSGGNDEFVFHIGSMFSSHGEVNRILGKGLTANNTVKDALVLLDEPDQALDFDGVGELIEALRKCPARQVLVAVHHPRIICCQDFHCVELVDGYRDKIWLEMLKLVERRES